MRLKNLSKASLLFFVLCLSCINYAYAVAYQHYSYVPAGFINFTDLKTVTPSSRADYSYCQAMSSVTGSTTYQLNTDIKHNSPYLLDQSFDCMVDNTRGNYVFTPSTINITNNLLLFNQPLISHVTYSQALASVFRFTEAYDLRNGDIQIGINFSVVASTDDNDINIALLFANDNAANSYNHSDSSSYFTGISVSGSSLVYLNQYTIFNLGDDIAGTNNITYGFAILTQQTGGTGLESASYTIHGIILNATGLANITAAINNSLPVFNVSYPANICFNKTTGTAIFPFNISASDYEGDTLLYATAATTAYSSIKYDEDFYTSDSLGIKPDYSVFSSNVFRTNATHNTADIFSITSCSDVNIGINPNYYNTRAVVNILETSPSVSFFPSPPIVQNGSFHMIFTMPYDGSAFDLYFKSNDYMTTGIININRTNNNVTMKYTGIDGTVTSFYNAAYNYSYLGNPPLIKFEYNQSGDVIKVSGYTATFPSSIFSDPTVTISAPQTANIAQSNSHLYAVSLYPVNTYTGFVPCFGGLYFAHTSLWLDSFGFFRPLNSVVPSYSETKPYTKIYNAMGTYRYTIYVTDDVHPFYAGVYETLVVSVGSTCAADTLLNPLAPAKKDLGGFKGIIYLFSSITKALRSFGNMDIIQSASPIFYILVFGGILWVLHDVILSLLFSSVVIILLAAVGLIATPVLIVALIMVAFSLVPIVRKMFTDSGGQD